jgi:hypothetical protein
MHALCKEFFPYHTSFDPERDCLVDTSPPATVVATAMSPPFRHSDERVARAHAAYLEALRAAR